ncbi:MAG: FliM/FliN family flagellar motor switch protein [Pirellulales bacterium]
MTELNADIIDRVRQTCQENAGAAAEVLAELIRSDQVALQARTPTTLDSDEMAGALSGPGIVLLFQSSGGSGAAVVMPASLGLLSGRLAEADNRARAELDPVAESLAGLLWPSDLGVRAIGGIWADDLHQTLLAAQPDEQAAVIPLEIAAGDGQGALYAIWPLAAGATLVAVADPGTEGTSAGDTPSESAATKADAAPLHDVPRAAGASHDRFDRLPAYIRSLLRIRVPVSVVLAGKKQSVGKILELVPGSLIQFDKSCDELLELCVGGRTVADGEAVKVGDKFGVRVNAIVLPRERYKRLQRERSQG